MLFSELRPRIDSAVQDVDRGAKFYANSLAQAQAAKSLMSSMPTTYAAVIAAVNSGAAANPTDEAWKAMKAEKDLAVADRAQVTAKAETIIAAFAAVEAHGAAAVLAKIAELE